MERFNLDFNFTQFLVGRPNAPGFDENQQLALAFSRSMHGGLQFVGEFYGQTQLKKTTLGFASSLWALTFTVVPRLVIDGGFEVGLTSGGPHRHALFWRNLLHCEPILESTTNAIERSKLPVNALGSRNIRSA